MLRKMTSNPHRPLPLSLSAPFWQCRHRCHGCRIAAAIAAATAMAAAISAAIVSAAIATAFWLIVVCPCTASLLLPPLPAPAVTAVGCRRRCHCYRACKLVPLAPSAATSASCFYHCFYHCSPWWCSKYYLDQVIFWTSSLRSPDPSAATAASVSTAVRCWLYFHCCHSLFLTQWPAPWEIILFGDVQNITKKNFVLNYNRLFWTSKLKTWSSFLSTEVEQRPEPWQRTFHTAPSWVRESGHRGCTDVIRTIYNIYAITYLVWCKPGWVKNS